ncbi:MAG TPA: hypothetical protein VGJ13_17045 [Pseudonocardiaceae bacterium]
MSASLEWQASDRELLAGLRALETQLHSTWARMLSVVAEMDSREIAGKEGYGTTVELVRAVARVPRSESRARVDAAADVLPACCPGVRRAGRRWRCGCRRPPPRWLTRRSARRMWR